MPDKRWSLIQKLDERSSTGKVGWEPTAEDGVYQASFPNYSVRILSRPGRAGGTDYVLQILDDTGTLIEEVADPDVASMTPLEESEAFEFMKNLYMTARRKAMGVDHALDQIIESLDDPFL